jgi:hypothetical protein
MSKTEEIKNSKSDFDRGIVEPGYTGKNLQ